jgi:hypothetical protein
VVRTLFRMRDTIKPTWMTKFHEQLNAELVEPESKSKSR